MLGEKNAAAARRPDVTRLLCDGVMVNVITLNEYEIWRGESVKIRRNESDAVNQML